MKAPRRGNRASTHGKKQRDENGELLLDFPAALNFHPEGEEIKEGHPAYVLSATPRKGVIATTRAAKVLTGIQGRAWVEKQTLHPIGVQCTLVKRRRCTAPWPAFCPERKLKSG